jgi:hypothetical protein
MGSTACPITPKAEFDRQLKLLQSVTTIAVVGMSPDTNRPSYEVGMYLRQAGYTIVPVHPKATAIEDLTVYPTLEAAFKAVPTIDLVDLFVAGERTPAIVEQACRLGLKNVWFQPGAEHEPTEEWARDKGMIVVTGACTMAVLARARS